MIKYYSKTVNKCKECPSMHSTDFGKTNFCEILSEIYTVANDKEILVVVNPNGIPVACPLGDEELIRNAILSLDPMIDFFNHFGSENGILTLSCAAKTELYDNLVWVRKLLKRALDMNRENKKHEENQ